MTGDDTRGTPARGRDEAQDAAVRRLAEELGKLIGKFLADSAAGDAGGLRPERPEKQRPGK